MKALVYHGPGQQSWDDVPDPVIRDPGDAIVRVDTTTICGTDLHIMKGDVPGRDRRAGSSATRASAPCSRSAPSVRNVAVGDRVIISCISSCGVCTYCRSGNPSHCLADEGAVGHRLDPRPPDRRHPGRAGAHPVRRQLALQAPRGRARRRRRAAVRHLPDRLRDGHRVRPGQAGRHRRRRRRRPGRPGRDRHGRAARRSAGHRHRLRREPARRRQADRRDAHHPGRRTPTSLDAGHRR